MKYFHFILDEQTIKALLSAGGGKPLSEILKDMVEKFFKYADRRRSLGRRQNRQYELIHPNRKIERQDVWFSMKPAHFNRILEIRHKFNFLSLAQVIRAMIDLFLGRCVARESFLGISGYKGKRKRIFFIEPDQILRHMMKSRKGFTRILNEYLII